MWPEYDSKEAFEAAVPEGPLRKNYKEVDGKWIVPPPDTSGEDTLKETLGKVRDELKESKAATKKAADELKAEQQRKKAEESGVTEEKLEELRTQIRSDVEATIGNMTPEQLSGTFPQFKTVIGERDEARGDVRGLRLDSQVKTIFGANGVRADKVDALFQLETAQFDLTDDGKPKLTEHPGKTIDVFVSDDLKKKYPEWFEGTKASGSGGSGSHDSQLGGGTGKATADEVIANPIEALNAARATTGAAK